jgi:acyl-coenzyme A thioesterase PaaI-like protein
MSTYSNYAGRKNIDQHRIGEAMIVGIDLPWTKMIKPELVDLTDDSITLKQTPEEFHLNHNGDMHVGVIFSMSAMAGMGVLVMPLGEIANSLYIVIKNVNIYFIAPAQGEIVFIGRISEEQQKRTLKNAREGKKIEETVHVEARDKDGNVVSKSTVTAVFGPKRS